MILLVGASASGKTEIGKYLRKEFGLQKAITHTTRAPRKGERDGLDYHFVTEDDFASLERKGFFVETTAYNGHHYGSSKKEIDDDKVVIVDPNGLKAYLALKDPSIVTFLLKARKDTRMARMKERGDSKEDIKKRIEGDQTAFAKESIAPTDYSIKTDSRSVEEIAEEIYADYLKTLKKRGIHPNVLIQ